ncbi:extracellular solute-binding protein [Paenibacillus sp. Z6-24]
MRQQWKNYKNPGRKLWVLAVAGVVLLLLAYSVYALESNRRQDAVSQLELKGNAGEADDTIQIHFWTPFSGGDISFMQELVRQYNEQNTDHIQVTMKNNKLDDYYTKLSTAIVTEEAPDVAVVHASMHAQYIPARFITDISAVSAQTGVQWDHFNPAILKRTVSDGRHYGLPLDTHFSVLYYNKKWLKQAGLYKDGQVIIKPGEEGFMEFLQMIQRKVPGDVAPLAVPNVRIDSLWLWWSLYAQMEGGGMLYTPDGSRASLNMPAARQSLELVASLYDQQLIPPDINNATIQFAQGKAALLFLGVWSIGSFEQVEGLDFGVMPFPQIYDKPGSWGDAHTLAFPVHSDQDPHRLAAAVKFAEWLTHHGAVWGKAGHVPAVRDQAASESYLSLPYRREYAGAADDVEYFPEHPKQSEVNDALVNELEKLWYGKQTVDQMLDRLEPLINGILKE